MAFTDSLETAGAAVGAAAPLVGLGLGIAGGIGKLFGGKSDYEKNKEELAKIKDPFYRIQDEYFQNRNTSANEAQYGFNPAEQNYYTTESQRGLGSSLNAATSTGGSPNYIADIFDTYNRGIGRTAAEGAQLRSNKLKEFYDRNATLGGQQNIQWALNEQQPIQNKRALLSGNMVAAKQNQTKGWDDILGAISAAGTAYQNSQNNGSNGNNGYGVASVNGYSTAPRTVPSVNPQLPQGFSNNPRQISSYLTTPSYATPTAAGSPVTNDWSTYFPQ